MLRGGLFTRYWLEDGIRQTSAYRSLNTDRVSELAAAIIGRWTALAGMARPSEAETEAEFIFPILDLLGWHHLPQAQPGRGRRDVADALLFLSAAAKDTARRESDLAARFQHGAVVVENEARNTVLDRSGGKGEAPSSQILRYLKRADGIPGSAVRWGLLTNGRFWRLYWSGARDRATGFFELDLPAILDPLLPPPVPAGASTDHWLRVFLLLFGREALAPNGRGRSFLDDAMAEGRRYEERITDSLSEAVFDRVFPRLVATLAATDPAARPADPAWREAVKEAALTLLFRFLFVLYAEDRDLLPVAHPGYQRYSLRALRDDAEAVAEGRLAVSERRHSWWSRTTDLFRAIAGGDRDLGLPAYNGGLFDDAEHPLLSRAAIPDAALAPILDDLSRAQAPEGTGTGRRRIQYRDLAVQQLGAVYERLLERDVVADAAAPAGVAVAGNATARHRTGSFYTTDALVSLIIAQAVGPILDQKRAAFAARAAALTEDRRPAADRLAELHRFDAAAAFLSLRVCDPAMGSGHFLVSLVDYLAENTLVAMSEAALVGGEEYVSPVATELAALRAGIEAKAAAEGWEVRPEHLDAAALVRRVILKRVIHGVDANPLAVELAKLSLWLHCFTVGAPLSFLNHHLRPGDSLLGEWVGAVRADLAREYGLVVPISDAVGAREAMAGIERLTDSDLAEVKQSADLFCKLRASTAGLRAFLNLHHARRWLPPAKDSPADIGIAAFFGAAWGEPLAVMDGHQELRAPGTDAPDIRKGSRRTSAAAAFAAFEAWREAADRLAVERGLLHWQPEFPGIWTAWEGSQPTGGFDAVIGNPPYVRQEAIKAQKPALKGLFHAFDGTADLYVYFYEQGLRLLRPGGRLSYVVTNKWLKASYAEGLRGMLARESWVEAVMDFGHAKGFFPDADVMPCVLVAQKPDPCTEPPEQVSVSVIPRNLVEIARLPEQVAAASFPLPRLSLGAGAWVLEPPAVAALLEKIRAAGAPLREYAGVGPRRGVLTGFNKAFVINSATRERLIREDARSEAVIKPYLRGQDIDRWSSDWAGQWMIFTRHGTDIDDYPAVRRHLEAFSTALEPRPTEWERDHPNEEWPGRKPGAYRWYEIQDNVAYYEDFARPKILYQEIQYHPQYALDRSGVFANNKAFFVLSDDPWLLGCLNSPLMWWHNWRHLGHAKDEALTPQGYQMENVPIARAGSHAEPAAAAVAALCAIQDEAHAARRLLAGWYRGEWGIEKPSNALRNPFALDADAFAAVIRRALPRRRLSAAEIAHIGHEHAASVAPAARRLAEAAALERRLDMMVNAAYGLTPEEVALLWCTAPPRMPIPPPN